MVPLADVVQVCPDDLDIDLVQQRAYTSMDTWKGHPAQTRLVSRTYSIRRFQELLARYERAKAAIIQEEQTPAEMRGRASKLKEWADRELRDEAQQERFEVRSTSTRHAKH